MLAIIDYGSGNLNSIHKALDLVANGRFEVVITQDAKELRRADRIVLPGVGVFYRCVENLKRLGILDTLQEEVLVKKKPFLGICLGMQVLAQEGEEFKKSAGFGWFDASVERLDRGLADPKAIRIPHYGWNEVKVAGRSRLFEGIPDRTLFYFVHSYYMRCRDQADVAATCDYGRDITAAVEKDNIFACQFHPEKSSKHGLKLLDNFCGWEPNKKKGEE